MKKIFLHCFTWLLISANIFAGTLKVGATPVPHAELLNYLKSDLKKEGVDLKIVEFTDFVTINEALIDGELDANYWQHLPHLTLIMQKEKKTDLVAVTKVHVETIGLYSTKIKSIKDLKVGKNIASLIMNANPFTLGHQYLVEKASSENDILHLFIVSDDSSLVPFEVRKKLVIEGTKHLKNISFFSSDFKYKRS